MQTLRLFIFVLLLSIIFSPPARAQDEKTATKNWTETPQLLLNEPTGLRNRAAKKGVVFNIDYGGETAHNYSGGERQLTEYTDQWDFRASVDTQKMGLWHGGVFQITYTDRTGENLGSKAGIGNNMLIQEVYGRGQTWHTTEFWFDQKFWADRLSFKFGRLPVGSDFASFSCDFQNLTFCGSQPGNLIGSYWLSWPTSVWAARVRAETSAATYAEVGVYQVNPNYVNDQWAQRYGRGLDSPGGSTGVLLPAEFGWTPKLNGRQGSYKFGLWYTTANAPDLEEDVNGNARGVTALDPLERSGQYGAYINFEQQLTGDKPKQGLSVFLNATQTDRNTARSDRQISIGTQYRGTFHRVNDMAGLALGATDANSRYATYVRENNARTGATQIINDGNEYVGEIYYSYAPIASLFLRPNLQYIINPGGSADNKNAFVLGLKTGLSL